MATVRFLANRIITYPMNDRERNREYDIAKEILINNQYDPRMLDKATDKIKRKSPKNAQRKKKMKQRILPHKTCEELNGQISPM